ncbi:hypothetical protein ACWC0C_41595 [Streptomyces sp. NPDC001709]
MVEQRLHVDGQDDAFQEQGVLSALMTSVGRAAGRHQEAGVDRATVVEELRAAWDLKADDACAVADTAIRNFRLTDPCTPPKHTGRVVFFEAEGNPGD